MTELNNTFQKNPSYGHLLCELKSKIYSTQIKAALSVNSQLINMYWELGNTIILQQQQHQWGSSFIDQLAHDLSTEFPEITGFSRGNLYYIKRWFLFYQHTSPIVPQLAEQLQKNKKKQKNIIEKQTITQPIQHLLAQIPWGHNRLIIEKVKDIK